jgi:hypothetical protein
MIADVVTGACNRRYLQLWSDAAGTNPNVRAQSERDEGESNGHRRSARASPTVLTARTVAKMNTPGNNASHGSVLIVVCA